MSAKVQSQDGKVEIRVSNSTATFHVQKIYDDYARKIADPLVIPGKPPTVMPAVLALYNDPTPVDATDQHTLTGTLVGFAPLGTLFLESDFPYNGNQMCGTNEVPRLNIVSNTDAENTIVTTYKGKFLSGRANGTINKVRVFGMPMDTAFAVTTDKTWEKLLECPFLASDTGKQLTGMASTYAEVNRKPLVWTEGDEVWRAWRTQYAVGGGAYLKLHYSSPSKTTWMAGRPSQPNHGTYQFAYHGLIQDFFVHATPTEVSYWINWSMDEIGDLWQIDARSNITPTKLRISHYRLSENYSRWIDYDMTTDYAGSEINHPPVPRSFKARVHDNVVYYTRAYSESPDSPVYRLFAAWSLITRKEISHTMYWYPTDPMRNLAVLDLFPLPCGDIAVSIEDITKKHRTMGYEAVTLGLGRRGHWNDDTYTIMSKEGSRYQMSSSVAGELSMDHNSDVQMLSYDMSKGCMTYYDYETGNLAWTPFTLSPTKLCVMYESVVPEVVKIDGMALTVTLAITTNDSYEIVPDTPVA